MSTKKKTATAKGHAELKDLGAKKNPKGGAAVDYFNKTGLSKSALNPQPLPP